MMPLQLVLVFLINDCTTNAAFGDTPHLSSPPLLYPSLPYHPIPYPGLVLPHVIALTSLISPHLPSFLLSPPLLSPPIRPPPTASPLLAGRHSPALALRCGAAGRPGSAAEQHCDGLARGQGLRGKAVRAHATRCGRVHRDGGGEAGACKVSVQGTPEGWRHTALVGGQL